MTTTTNCPYYIATISSQEIEDAWPHLTAWARETIVDIARRAQRYDGHPSNGQLQLILKLLGEAQERAARPQRAPTQLLDLTRILEMFATASKALKRPFVVFLVDGQEFRASLAPATGKNPGSIYVKAASGAYAGKISPQGRFQASREAPEGILAALQAFAADPVKAALAYGQATGSCCFCARELTDARSVTAGYGPICASRWGLPWGVQAIACEEVSEQAHLDELAFVDASGFDASA